MVVCVCNSTLKLDVTSVGKPLVTKLYNAYDYDYSRLIKTASCTCDAFLL